MAGCTKIPEYTKGQIVKYIRELFAQRPETFKQTRWLCVLRGNKLMVVRRFQMDQTDLGIIECILESGHLPSWFSVYGGVRRNWHKLITSDIRMLKTEKSKSKKHDRES
jgi:hypothetical protein